MQRRAWRASRPKVSFGRAGIALAGKAAFAVTEALSVPLRDRARGVRPSSRTAWLVTIDQGPGPCRSKAHGSSSHPQSRVQEQVVQEYAAGATHISGRERI